MDPDEMDEEDDLGEPPPPPLHLNRDNGEYYVFVERIRYPVSFLPDAQGGTYGIFINNVRYVLHRNQLAPGVPLRYFIIRNNQEVTAFRNLQGGRKSKRSKSNRKKRRTRKYKK